MGSPTVSSGTFWAVYQGLLQCFLDSREDAELASVLTTHRDTVERFTAEEMPLLSNMEPFRNGENLLGPKGYKYIGGLADPPTDALRGKKKMVMQDDSSGSENAEGLGPEYAALTSSDEDN
jgi:hypothetical protein